MVWAAQHTQEACMDNEIRRHEQWLKSVLEQAGLGTELLGRRFIFSSVHGSHSTTKVGTIIGIDLSNELGLVLEVSNREFYGLPLVGLCFEDGEKTWSAMTRSERDFRPFSGLLHIYD